MSYYRSPAAGGATSLFPREFPVDPRVRPIPADPRISPLVPELALPGEDQASYAMATLPDDTRALDPSAGGSHPHVSDDPARLVDWIAEQLGSWRVRKFEAGPHEMDAIIQAVESLRPWLEAHSSLVALLSEVLSQASRGQGDCQDCWTSESNTGAPTNPGTCPKKCWTPLRDAVKPYKSIKACTGADDEAALKTKLNDHRCTIMTRKRIAESCYCGGEKGHDKAICLAERNRNDCVTLLVKAGIAVPTPDEMKCSTFEYALTSPGFQEECLQHLSVNFGGENAKAVECKKHKTWVCKTPACKCGSK